MKNRFATLSIAVFAMVLTMCLASCVSDPFMVFTGPRIHVSEPFIIAKSKRPMGWGFLSHPIVYAFSNNLAVANYNLAGDGAGGSVPADIKDMAPALTSDGGVTWQYGKTAMTSEFTGAEMPLGIIIQSTGGVFSMTSQFSEKRAGVHIGQACWVKDGLVERPFEVICNTAIPAGEVYLSSPGFESPSGELMMVGYGSVGNAGLNSTFLFKSADGGHNFDAITVADAKDVPWGFEGACEPGFVYFPDGEMICIMRSGANAKVSNPMLLARSMDGGKTWTKRQFFDGVSPRLVLMRNGVVVCAFGRPGNSLIFSVDKGRTWGDQISLSSADSRTTGYIGIVEVSPGRLLATYDEFNTSQQKIWLWDPPNEINGVFGVFVDVAYTAPARK